MSVALATRIAEEFAASVESGGDERRRLAIQELTERGLPTSRDENWKYANLRPLEKVRFAPPARQTAPAVAAQDLPAPIEGYARYVFVDGQFASALSAQQAHTGVSVRSLKSMPVAADSSAALTETALAPDLRFALLNTAFSTDGASVRVEPNTDCPACVELVLVASADSRSAASYPRINIQVGAGSRVGLIERHISAGNDANFVNCAVEVELARDARVQHYRVQQTGSRAIWLDSLTARLAENAQYRLHSVSLGGQSARSTVHVQLSGEHSEVGLYAASMGDRNQVQDMFALVEHIAPNARTEQIFRGISGGRARVAFNGKIIVRKGARGTDSQQSLRGLLAGKDAEIDVRPQLEIYTDDVRCNHGATAGKLDDNMLFYLLSRGLDRETAQRLLKWAFLEDVVARIDVPELRRQIELSLAGQMNGTAGLQGAPYTAHGQLPRDDGERADPAKQELL